MKKNNDPENDIIAVDISDRKVEAMARGFIMGSQAIGRRREVRAELENRVVKKIGAKGKVLTDKLFELIEGVAVIDKRGGANGKDIRYYTVPPNLQAIIYALDRVLGKPVVHTEHVEEKRGVMIVESIIRNLAGEKIEYGNEIDEPKQSNGKPAFRTTDNGGLESRGRGRPRKSETTGETNSVEGESVNDL